MLARTPGLEVTPEAADEAHEVDFGLHLDVIGFMTNPLLDRAYRQVYDHLQLVRLDQAYMYSAAAIARTMQEHIAIIRACLARDPDAAAAALEHHFAKAMQRALGL